MDEGGTRYSCVAIDLAALKRLQPRSETGSFAFHEAMQLINEQFDGGQPLDYQNEYRYMPLKELQEIRFMYLHLLAEAIASGDL